MMDMLKFGTHVDEEKSCIARYDDTEHANGKFSGPLTQPCMSQLTPSRWAEQGFAQSKRLSVYQALTKLAGRRVFFTV